MSDVRLKLTITLYYDAVPEWYEGCGGDPSKMAAVDRESLESGRMSAQEFIDGASGAVEYTVEPDSVSVSSGRGTA